MVKAGDPTDAVIDELVPLLDEGDIVIDCGNAHYADTRRREAALREHGLHFVGCGVSGGEEGALKGPSIMPGGSAESYEKLGPIFESIAAVVDGTPCCVHVGPDGAGHFVKMVHNGIEYADMQLIAEAYDLLRHGLSRVRRPRSPRSSASGTRATSSRSSSRSPPTCWRTPTRTPARRSSTSCSTRPSRRAPGAGRCRARSTSASRSPASPRRRSRGRCPGTPSSASRPASGSARPSAPIDVADRDAFVEDVRLALYASKVVAYAQGFDHIAAGSDEYDWSIDPGAMATIWRGGCIIRARFLDRIREAYDDDPELPSLLVAPYFADAVAPGRRRVAPGRLGGRARRHPDAGVLVLARLLRRAAPRPAAGRAHPGPARQLRRAHVPPRRPGRRRSTPSGPATRRSTTPSRSRRPPGRGRTGPCPCARRGRRRRP